MLNSFAENRPDIQVYNVALSDRQGAAILQVPVDAAGIEHDSSATIEKITIGSFREHHIQLATLDSYRFRDIELIKIDVEGHESRVINGAAQTISSRMPALLIEIEQRHLDRPISEVFEQVQNFGYEGFFLGSHGTLYPLSEFDPVSNQAETNLGSRRDCYINNFLFFHRTKLAVGQYSAIVRAS